jgi:hypothetical protein
MVLLGGLICQCYFIADSNPDDSQRQRVLRAAASCPVQAILVERLDDTEEGATS